MHKGSMFRSSELAWHWSVVLEVDFLFFMLNFQEILHGLHQHGVLLYKGSPTLIRHYWDCSPVLIWPFATDIKGGDILDCWVSLTCWMEVDINAKGGLCWHWCQQVGGVSCHVYVWWMLGFMVLYSWHWYNLVMTWPSGDDVMAADLEMDPYVMMDWGWLLYTYYQPWLYGLKSTSCTQWSGATSKMYKVIQSNTWLGHPLTHT